MNNNIRVYEAKKAINAIFGNTQVPPEETLKDLNDIMEVLRENVDAIEDDLGAS